MANTTPGLRLLHPAPELCQSCACAHHADEPHNQQSLFWALWFRGEQGRWPTWADAAAHCTPVMQDLWRAEIEAMGLAWE